MSSEIERSQVAPPSLPAPARVSQATAVEQSRAVAEVHAAILVAQQCPRNMSAALAEVQESCGQEAIANRAFFEFRRAGQKISGPTIHLAREAARCFGNVQYGVDELARDDIEGVSEMLAWAWDVEKNTRASQKFLVPHKRDTKTGQKTITDLRDIYENNTNQGSRRLREAIFAVLPTWYVEAAKASASDTLQNGGGVPLATRIAGAVENFAGNGVARDQLEQWVGRPSASWTPHDVGRLGALYTSLKNGETTVDAEFPTERVDVSELKAPEAIKDGGGSS